MFSNSGSASFPTIILAGPTVLSAVGVNLRMMVGGDAGGSMLKSRSAFRRARKKSDELTIAIYPGRDVFSCPFGRISVMPSLGNNLLRPVELGSIDPHAMQNDRELTGDCNLALRSPLRLASLTPQAFTADHFGTRVSRTPAASNR